MADQKQLQPKNNPKVFRCYQIIDSCINKGFSSSDILDLILKVLTQMENISEIQRVNLIKIIIETIMISENSPSNIHLYQLISQFCQLNEIFLSKK